MFNPLDLTGKLILVTGASSGIGRATAIVLSKLGAQVILNGRNNEALQMTVSKMENCSISPNLTRSSHGCAIWLSSQIKR
jgi:NADP-dependent 3-hydroxy acid dehydrogenase YdfG